MFFEAVITSSCFSCQFIVNEKGDYKQYMTNQDALVDWDLIEQVVGHKNLKKIKNLVK